MQTDIGNDLKAFNDHCCKQITVIQRECCQHICIMIRHLTLNFDVGRPPDSSLLALDRPRSHYLPALHAGRAVPA